MKQFTKSKRLLSGFLSVVMAISAIPIASVTATESTDPYPYTMFAGSSDEGAITIDARNVCVNGSIATNGTIAHNGNFNVNGTITENADAQMIIIFDKINNQYFMSSSVDEYENDFILNETNININIPTEIQGEAVLTGNININSAFKALDDVVFNGDVENTDNSVIFSQYGDIIIDSQNVNLNGLVYAPYGCVDITAQNLNMNSVVIIADSIVITCPNFNANYSSNMASFVGTTSEDIDAIEKFIILFGEYNEFDETIDMAWITNSEAKAFEIRYSDDAVNYFSLDYTEDSEYQYDIDEDFEARYFKVISTESDGTVVESDPICVVRADDRYDIQYIDSDGDGLQDSYEALYGTDPENPDSDGDNLTDGFEVLKSHTDPTLPDTDDNGVTDDAEDFDDDGLNNYTEMLLGTDPYSADTDDDGLTDGDEVNIYGTDPLNPDTDNDGILDIDEINFNLNPNNSSDADTPIPQHH